MKLQHCSGGEDVAHVWSCVIETGVHMPIKKDMVLIGGAIFMKTLRKARLKGSGMKYWEKMWWPISELQSLGKM